jgi:Transposase DDE domain
LTRLPPFGTLVVTTLLECSMSDNLKRYLAILGALKQLCPTEPQGNYLRNLHTLAAMISGIVGSQRTSLPAIANKMAGTEQRQSRIQRLSRWIKNERITSEAFFLPFADELLASLPEGPLVCVMDGSEVGRGCLALVMSVLFGKRALPLCWIVVAGKKGHFPEEKHLELLGQVAKRVPTGRDVIFLGDGEFDGCGLLCAVQQQGWEYVCRTAKNVVLREAQEGFGFSDLCVQRGELLSIPDVAFTGRGLCPVTVIACWEEPYQEPLFLVTNLELAWEATQWYKRRYAIETFFSDQKSRGFHLGHCHLSDPKRLSRLLIGSCLAYIWIVYLGALVHSDPKKMQQVHRRDRCDLSLFTLGLAWLDECLNRGEEIPVAFKMPTTRTA